MAKMKKIVINKLEFEVHELLVCEIEELYEKVKDLDFGSIFTNMDLIEFVINKTTKNKIGLETIKKWSPSEVEECLNTVKEINSSFLNLLSKIIPENLGSIVKEKILSIFTSAFSD